MASLTEAQEWTAVYESEPESYLPKCPEEPQHYRIRSFIFKKPTRVEGNAAAAGLGALAAGGGTVEATEDYYDKWASSYDRDLIAWGYQAPGRVAGLCEKHGVAKDAPICDVGCGTGLSGEGLAAQGFTNIHGCDLSPASIDLLKQHKAHIYKDVKVVDMNQTPYPYPEGGYGAVTCVGTLSYFNGKDMYCKIFKEFLRLLRPDGLVLFTFREDLLNKPETQMCEAIASLTEAKEWISVYESEPESYLPKCPEEQVRNYRIRTFIFQRPGMEMKVSTKKSAGFYIRAASNFLKGMEAREADGDKEAVEAKEPVDLLKISGLGDAINTAVAAATRAEAEGIGEITSIQTQYPEMTSGRGCAQISILVKKK